jgi:hypothetical protein
MFIAGVDGSSGGWIAFKDQVPSQSTFESMKRDCAFELLGMKLALEPSIRVINNAVVP